MELRLPISNRTDTLVPYKTLVRSDDGAGADRIAHAGRCLGPDADDARSRTQRLDRRADPADQPAAADADKDGVEVRRLPRKFHPQRPLPRHRLDIIIGGDISLDRKSTRLNSSH